MDELTLEARLMELERATNPHLARAELVDLVTHASRAGSPRVAAGAAITLASYYVGVCEFDAAAEMCRQAATELAHVVAPVERARLVLAHAHAVLDRYPDEPPLKKALPVLEGAGRWADASGAAALLAEAAARNGRVEMARRYFARAIGAAEAHGLQTRGPALLRELASVEIHAGHADVGELLVRAALRRLAPVLLLHARLEEAQCLNCLGDAARAQHRAEEARAYYQDALDRLTHLEAGGGDEIRRKLKELG